eukprot:CFRG5044T1
MAGSMDVSEHASALDSFPGGVNEPVAEIIGEEDLNMFQVVSGIVNRSLQKVITECTAGKLVLTLCAGGDQCMNEEINAVYKAANTDKGIAFPTCVSINNCVGNYSSLPNDQLTLSVGDIVKIEMAAHIGGNVASVCHTHVVPLDGKSPLSGRGADAICAAYYASETALRMIHPGASSHSVTKAINQVAEAFNCKPVGGVVSSNMTKFSLDGDRTIEAISDPDHHDFEFEMNEIYQVDIAMTTGEGKTKDLDFKPTVYRRNRDKVYQLKLKGSRALFGRILKNNPDCAFSIRDYVQADPRSTAMGVPECLKSELLLAYPVRFESKNDVVARFRFTMLLLPSGPVRITGAGTVPYVQSEYSIADEDLNALLATAVNDKSSSNSKRTNKKKSKSKKNFNEEPREVSMAM